MLYLFGIGINFFLILLLFSKKDKILADKFLLAWLIIICCHLLLFVVATSIPGNKYIDVFAIAPLFPLLHGPMLYLYSAALTNMLPENKKIWTLHFIPFIVVLIIISPFLILSPEEKIAIIDSGGKGFEIQIRINNYSTLISGIVYVIWLFVILNKHKQNIANQFSYEEKIKLNWLRYLIYGLGIIWIIIIAQKINETSYDNLIFGFAVVLVIIIGYFGIKQGRIYSNTISQQLNNNFEISLNLEKIENNITNSEISEIRLNQSLDKKGQNLVKKKYANSGLTEITSQIQYEKLNELMQIEKFYTEPELTLSALAEKLDIYPNHLSQIINEKEGKNFYDYINKLRVEEFIRQVLLPENSKFTMMSIALDCGFNSKSSFNKNFKKVTGQSPTEYLNKRSLDSIL
ncbi:helix-turn-helix domain-containing protein [Sediminibacterium sp.]|uniref:helix-turn-helix domain-containing protein n=1 Tax=Sediminibacterium sp. TaxID=1917865 RepID=UPI003F704A3C